MAQGAGEQPPEQVIGRVAAPDLLDSAEAGPAAIRGSALRAAGYAGGVLLGLAAIPLLVRHLGVVRFGDYVVVMSLVALAGGLSEGGLTSIGVREYAVRDGVARAAAMQNLLGIRLVVTTVGIVGACAFALAAGYEDALVVGTALAGVGLLLQTSQSLLTVPLATGLRYGWITVTELLRQAITVALVISLVLAGAGLVAFLAVPIPAALAALVLTAVLVRGAMPMRPAFSFGEWGPLLRDTAPYAAAIALNVAYFRLAIIITSLLATALQTGYFATSYRVLEVFVAIPGLVVGAVFPILARAARDDPARLSYAAGRIFEVAIISGLWMVLAIELAAGFMIDVVGGAEAEPAVDLLRIQAFALLGTFVAMACGFPLLSLRRHAALLVPNVVALVVTIGLLALLVPKYEARGAAVVTVSAEALLGLTTAILLLRARPGLRLPFSIVPIALLAAGAAAAVALVPNIHDVARVAIATVVYVGLLALTRRIPPEVLEAIAPGRRRRMA